MSVESRPLGRRGARGTSPLVIGLTGPIASGKSTVAGLLRDRGAAVIDADQVYRSLLTPGSEVWQSIVSRFGDSVISPDRQIDRAALGAMVFRDPQALADLERITHPPVVARIRRRIASSETDVVVVEAVKLVESGLLADVDSLWLVTADPDVRLRRLAARRGLSEADARDRLGASLHVAELHAPIDVVIDNSGDMSQLTRAVANAWRALIPQSESPFPEPMASVDAKENA